jgi:hypothetical protein
MSEKTLGKIADKAREAASTVAWRQWATLGSIAESETAVRSMIDPEALVLISLALSNYEKRFWDVLKNWSFAGVRLLSVQRVKNLAISYPESTRRLVAEYAFFAHDTLGDHRWKSLSKGSVSPERNGRDKRWEAEMNFTGDPALMFRLRLGIGVNMRADVLAMLLAIRGEAVSVRQLAEALRYTNAATRRAAEDLASARLIHVSSAGKPDTYSADTKAWGRALGLSGLPPRWRRWQESFEYLAAVSEWEKSSRGRKISDYALETLGNELAVKHSRVFEYTGADVRRGRPVGAHGIVGSFEVRTLKLCDRMVEYV